MLFIYNFIFRNMKKISSYLFAFLASTFLVSCSSTYYYQVYKATPTESVSHQAKNLIYEDDNCLVYYNLWSEGGDIGFKFFNKTDKNIYLNKEQCFFIHNGMAYNYYQNRIFTNSTSSGASATKSATASKSVTGINYLDLLQTNKIQSTATVGSLSMSGYSVSFNEEKTICIPAKTAKEITEFAINESLFRDCDLLKYPTKKLIKTMYFDKEKSPLVFSNIISYSFEGSDKIYKFENQFYISEITNYPETEIITSASESYCNQTSYTLTKFFKNVSPDKFYIKYTKGNDQLRH